MKYCIANWKMNMTSKDALTYLNEIEKNAQKNKERFDNVAMIICPPYTALDLVSAMLAQENQNILSNQGIAYIKNIELGAQNMNPNSNGAYTGEISASMLNQYGIKWSILGHSERRTLFNESNELINLKVKAALNNNISPILCVGETLEERDSGKTEAVLSRQLEECLSGVFSSSEFLIAYEPVWAIGTGRTADNNIIEFVNNIILDIIKGLKCNVKKPKILYGGSVNNNNAKNLSKICNLDGFLIGGASLDAEQFYSIYNALKGE